MTNDELQPFCVYGPFSEAVRESFEAFAPYGFVFVDERRTEYGIYIRYRRPCVMFKIGYEYREGIIFYVERDDECLVPPPYEPFDHEAYDWLLPRKVIAESIYILRTGDRIVHNKVGMLSGSEITSIIREHVEAMLTVAEDLLQGDLSVFRALVDTPEEMA